ncbi:hypothetical protein PENSPDRAFT_694351 [Peniophora sp. CONT]|nr:hypothetical protein PENSPDRAFT_694351 [Peniophora sp. CONT]
MAPVLNSFHDAQTPLHTHPGCDFCKQMRRCVGPDGSMKLSRCKQCGISQYCSKDCQTNGWKSGHKLECKERQFVRDNAVLASGNQRAWVDFAQWREHHHDSLTNAALAHYILNGPGSEKEYVLYVMLRYINDPQLPVERKFELYGYQFVHKDAAPSTDPMRPSPPPELMEGVLLLREYNEKQFRTHSGVSEEDARMGAYILSLKFAPLGQPEPNGVLPFYRTFQFTDEQRNAKVNDKRLPAATLARIFRRGRRQRFCCGKVPGLPTCCCGGWTHEPMNEATLDGDSDGELNIGEVEV